MKPSICSHSRGHWYQPAGYDDEGEPFDPEWIEQSTYEDISMGAFRCTQCGDIGYYTGRWRDYYEKDIPCLGSENLKKENPMNTSTGHGADMAAEIKRLAYGIDMSEPGEESVALTMLIERVDRLAALASCAKQGEPVAWLMELKSPPHRASNRSLNFERPHERSDWTVTPLYAAAQPTEEDWQTAVQNALHEQEQEFHKLLRCIDYWLDSEPLDLAMLSSVVSNALNGVYATAHYTQPAVAGCPTRAEKMRAAGHTRRPTVRELADRLCQDEPGSGAQGLSLALASKPDARHVVRQAIAKLPTYVVEWGGARFMCVDRDAAMDAAAPPPDVRHVAKREKRARLSRDTWSYDLDIQAILLNGRVVFHSAMPKSNDDSRTLDALGVAIVEAMSAAPPSGATNGEG